MRTSIFVVACSLTAVFACGGTRNVQKSDTQTKTETSIKKDSSGSGKLNISSEEGNVAIWDNETILEIYGDDIAVNRYDGSDSITTVPIKGTELLGPGTKVFFGEAGIIGITGAIKRITHKSKGKDSSSAKVLVGESTESRVKAEIDTSLESTTKTKNVQKEGAKIPWLGIGLLGLILVAAGLLIRKAFF